MFSTRFAPSPASFADPRVRVRAQREDGIATTPRMLLVEQFKQPETVLAAAGSLRRAW
jgi:hypothetical protein